MSDNDPYCPDCDYRHRGKCGTPINTNNTKVNHITIDGQEIEVKPCPFCGSEDVRHDSAMGFPYLFCESCDAYGPPAQSDAHAVEAWNRRQG